MIQQGSKSPEVLQWQKFLVQIGNNIAVDGIFGAGTRQATMNFQKSVGLTADGIVGKNTYTAARQKGYAGDYNA
ncbi:peptidoglycan-binding domain-containing protein [Hugenholtzia roseola]|uniref:peptidoglycan-binding domain-containing protein n=1 Tax=Hugenholtzia roseola TaxID=1002 RepID=UPI000687AC12|nr:peptidoglycan-binding domain-containing protein [Hugenholtzia roseola]